MSSFGAHQWSAVQRWFEGNGRALPWRGEGVTPWGVLVSEMMLHQTPVARVVEPWQRWMALWPTPASLAAAPTADLLRMWGNLGYPRRALRLQQAARSIVDEHEGVVPDSEQDLLALPGIGSYTAAAIMAFAHGRRSLVLDTNVRRVLARHVDGSESAPRTQTRAERASACASVPVGDREASAWSAAVMELGALICTARNPACGACPVADSCAWLAAGRPVSTKPRRAGQAWAGTDRQCRGRIMAALRGAESTLDVASVTWPDEEQRLRCAQSLVSDGLAVAVGEGPGPLRLTLPT